MNTGGRKRKVKVWVRTRPTAQFDHNMIDLLGDGKTVNIHCKRDPKRGVVNNQILDWSFKLDGIMHNASQDQVFSNLTSGIVSQTLNGYNGTIMCYGQTGAGKTFTMTGATENYKHRGVIPRAISQLFKEIDEKPDYSINVRVSYLEIYNESMFDLLSTLPDSLEALEAGTAMTVAEDENGVYVKGLTCHLAQSEEEALNLLFEGETNRIIAEHSLNKNSSRSHCIFTIYIESRSRVQSEARYTLSKLNFVDLAGSERLSKTKSEGKTQQEAMYINKSLSFLEQTVIALADKRRDHVPFRQTKLTHYLKDSIGGNCSTLLIANIWGEAEQIEETVSTLRFATRMMCVQSEPAINEHYDPAIMVMKLQKEIGALRHELAMHDTLCQARGGTNRSQITYEPLSEQQRFEIRQQVRAYVEGSLDEIDIVNIRQIQGVHEAFRDLAKQMKEDIERDFKARYTLVDKTDPTSIAQAQAAGLPIDDNGELVGETVDASGFGVGQAPPGARPVQSSVINTKKKERGRKTAGSRGDRSSPAPRTTSSPAESRRQTDGSRTQSPPADKADDKEPRSPSSQTDIPKAISKPSTPPPRVEAFEDFKREQGSEINRILLENKEILATKKKAYADLAKQINMNKSEIDKSRMKLETLKATREEEGPMLNDDGDIIITEEEYLEIKRLKDMKAVYKQDFEELKTLKSETQYCQKLVDQCRQKLIQEFDSWFVDSFLSTAEGEPKTSAEAGLGIRAGTKDPEKVMVEDEQEKFDRLQNELLQEDPDSAAFYNAKMRTERRKIYETAMSQAQPAMMRKPPGTPTRTLRHKPPTMLQVQF